MTVPLNAAGAKALIERLELQPHPEGGHYRETFRAPASSNRRSDVTLIYYLLQAGERARWHRVDATEIWHHYLGAPLLLSVTEQGQEGRAHNLGPDILAGETPQVVVPPHAWQTAESLGAWTLIGCTVAPGFEFAGFELAPPGWEPGR